MDNPRSSFTDSCRYLQKQGYLDIGPIPHLPDRLPKCDDEKPRVSFFRTRITDMPSLANLTIPRSFFGRSKLLNASFRNTDLSESNLCWNDFVGVDFCGAILTRSDMRASFFSKSDFTLADLREADLRRATFENCMFDGAILDGAVLTREQAEMLILTSEQQNVIAWQTDPGDEPDGG